MKIAIVQERVEAWRGGAETSTLEMAASLAALGGDVTVVCAAGGDAGRDAPPAGPIKLHPLGAGGGSRTQQTIRFISEADRYCRLEGFDIIHAITPCISANVYQPRGGTYIETVRQGIASGRTWAGKVAKWFSRRTNRRQRFLLLLERSILTAQRPPMVAALSEYVRRQVREGYGVPDERVRIVFNGVDIVPLAMADAAAARDRVRRSMNFGERTPLALFAAHNFSLKGLRELMESAATAVGHETGFHVLIAGRDHEAPFRRRARRLGVGDRFHFIGPTEDMRPLYAAVDLLAHPTWYDPCSRVALEALTCGLPVVTTRFNGAADVIEDGRNGFVINRPDQAVTLAESIRRACTPELRESSRAAAATAGDGLSMSRHACELLALYATVTK